MLKIDDSKSARAKYIDHPLFKNCIEIWCPIGWIPYLDQIVEGVERYNSICEENDHIAFAQVKIKFGILTVYIQPIVKSNKSAMQKSFDAGLYDFIKEICSTARDHCTICGNQLIETVIDSQVKKICWNHMPHNKYSRNGKI